MMKFTAALNRSKRLYKKASMNDSYKTKECREKGIHNGGKNLLGKRWKVNKI